MLAQDHDSVIIIGYSMGGAIAMQVAAQSNPCGLILLAPFWRMEGNLWRLLPVLKHLFPTIKPFDLIAVDFENADMRANIQQFFPDEI